MDWLSRWRAVLFGAVMFLLIVAFFVAILWPTTQTYTVRTCTSDGHGSYDCKETP